MFEPEIMDPRQLPAVTNRVETGPVQFAGDFPGVFVRGDNAAFQAGLMIGGIERVLSGTPDAAALTLCSMVLPALQSLSSADCAGMTQTMVAEIAEKLNRAMSLANMPVIGRA